MAKVIITIEDSDDGDVKVTSQFDPPLDNTGTEDEAVERMTQAQRLGAYATMQLLKTDDGLGDEEE